MQIGYQATQAVERIIATLGRTEDIKFSPNNKRLAIAAFTNNTIAVFDIRLVVSSAGPHITLPRATEIRSSALQHPHGLDFIDDEHIIVANRDGDVSIFQLPSTHQVYNCYELAPLEFIGSFDILNSPGSVAVIRKETNLYDALICNNYSHSVTRHSLELTTCCKIRNNKLLLRKWLDIPDGVCISNDSQWVAISNHGTHCVLLYQDINSVNERSSPNGILGSVSYPHGLKFTSDGRFILVADAGSPNVHIYGKGTSNWHGVLNPLISYQTMKDEDFLRGRYNPQEGGPKGIDISSDMTVFVTTTEYQPLAFFDLRAVLGRIDSRP
jgi:DNA-binding beta-propeller fold protein YncE